MPRAFSGQVWLLFGYETVSYPHLASVRDKNLYSLFCSQLRCTMTTDKQKLLYSNTGVLTREGCFQLSLRDFLICTQSGTQPRIRKYAASITALM